MNLYHLYWGSFELKNFIFFHFQILLFFRYCFLPFILLIILILVFQVVRHLWLLNYQARLIGHFIIFFVIYIPLFIVSHHLFNILMLNQMDFIWINYIYSFLFTNIILYYSLYNNSYFYYFQIQAHYYVAKYLFMNLNFYVKI
jgi:hypothetical protein